MNHRYMELVRTLERAYGETFVFHMAPDGNDNWAVYCSSIDSARSVEIATGVSFWYAESMAGFLEKMH